MTRKMSTPSEAQLELVAWAARIGAVTAEALAHCEGRTAASARARLSAAERAGLFHSSRPLTDAPALFTATRAGLRAVGLLRLGVTRVTASNAAHTIASVAVAATLETHYPGHRVTGEGELRAQEREHGAPLASARLGMGPYQERLHRPDLVLWPDDRNRCLPLAVEVELTVKAPRRLAEICRAWARCRCVAGVLYVAAPGVLRPLARAIEAASAGERIAVLGLDALVGHPQGQDASARTVSSDA
jgi:hypothetical protein